MSLKELGSDNKYLTVDDVAALMQVSNKTVYDWVHKKVIPYYKIVGSLRFDYDEVARWLRSHRHKPKGRANIL